MYCATSTHSLFEWLWRPTMTEDKQVDQGRAEGEVDTTGADEVDTAEKVDPGRVEEVATVRQVVVVRVEEDCPVDEEWTEKVM